jgi:hypothetical protein
LFYKCRYSIKPTNKLKTNMTYQNDLKFSVNAEPFIPFTGESKGSEAPKRSVESKGSGAPKGSGQPKGSGAPKWSKEFRVENLWYLGGSIIPMDSYFSIRNQTNYRAKSGYQFFLEHYAKKFNGRWPPGGAWYRLPTYAKNHFNMLAYEHNAFFRLQKNWKEDELIPLPNTSYKDDTLFTFVELPLIEKLSWNF